MFRTIARYCKSAANRQGQGGPARIPQPKMGNYPNLRRGGSGTGRDVAGRASVLGLRHQGRGAKQGFRVLGFGETWRVRIGPWGILGESWDLVSTIGGTFVWHVSNNII